MKAVFLPGMDGTGMLFDPVIRLWPANAPPPLVLSYPSDQLLSYDQLKAYVMDRLPTQEPFILIAESFGGPLAVRVAADRPPMLKGLVLCATFVRPPQAWLGRWMTRWIGPYLFKGPLLPTLGKWSMRAQGLADWQIQLLLKAITHDRPKVLAYRLKEIAQVDAVADLKNCPVPVLCLYAERDLFLTRRCHELIGKVTPNVQLIGLDTPHFLLQSKPAEALQYIQAFIQKLPA